MKFSYLRESWKTDCGTHTKKLVFVRLSDYADDDGICWPSIKTIADECNLSERAVQIQLAALESDGLIAVEQRGGRHLTNRYRIVKQNPAQDAPFEPKRCTGNGVSHAEKGERRSEKGARHSQKGAWGAPDSPRVPKGTPNDPPHTNGEIMSTESLENFKRAQLALSIAYRRDPKQRWSYCDESALSEIVRSRPNVESELGELIAYKERAGRYFPKLRGLLDDWDGTLDRARMPDTTRKPDHRAERAAKEYPQTIKAKLL